jgi:hypothetical protein
VREAVAADLHALWPSRFPAPPANPALEAGAAAAGAPPPPPPPPPPPALQPQREDAAAARGGAALLAAGAGGAVDTAALQPAGEDAEDVFVEVPRKV